MVLYAASDTPLPLIDPREPPEQPPLSVRPAGPDEVAVRARFTKPHVYFLGAHTGCSCGFAYDEPGNEAAAGRESVRQLRAFLAVQLRAARTLELYSCWDGDEGEPTMLRERVTTDYFRDDADYFELPERWLASVEPA